MEYQLTLCYIILAYTIGLVCGLECWNCIGEDCHLDPSTNYKATKVTCRHEHESCQKVEYNGRDNPSQTDYFSLVRSCSQGKCIPHADNCTHILKTNPGCMVRSCCKEDLCNAAPPWTHPWQAAILATVLCVAAL